MARHEIDPTLPLYVEYFHPLKLNNDDVTDILNPSTGPTQTIIHPDYDPIDMIDEMIKPLTNNSILREDGGTLRVPLEGLLHLPDAPFVPPFPLLIILHGNHSSYFNFSESRKPEFDSEGKLTMKGVLKLVIRGAQISSYTGYEPLQLDLAGKGIASYSINLNIPNCFNNNEDNGFKSLCLDTNQRILLFFHHLKLLKMIAGEALSITGADPFPIKLRVGTGWKNLSTELSSASINTDLLTLKTALTGKIDFNRLGLMGHSRGADTVSRIPAYFFDDPATPGIPTFPGYKKVTDKIKKLVEQVGKPTKDQIKTILALEPVAAVNDDDPDKHGYIIENSQTMFFAAQGTHDEDVKFDSVRIYEYPKCSKALIAINGASHQRFNSNWAIALDETNFDTESLNTLLSTEDHEKILLEVFSRCFTATMGGIKKDWNYFTRKSSFVLTLSKAFYIQMAWKFGFPIETGPATLTNLDDKVTGVPEKDPASSSFKFEQHLKAFFVEKSNEGNFVIKIPIDAGSDLSKFSHFSFRFARGYELGSKPERTEVKNFTLQLFNGNTSVGKLIEGSQFDKLELKALRATPTQPPLKKGKKFKFEYSILLQTAEIELDVLCSKTERHPVNRIEITVIPDKTKGPPPSTGEVIFGSVGGAVMGAGIGAGGGLGAALAVDADPDTRDSIMTWSSVGVGALGALIGYFVSRADTNAFVF